MEDTQVIDWESEEEETEISSDFVGSSLEPLGRLHIFSSTHGPEKDFLLYLGENVVGRMPDCAVTLPFPSISKQHAVIEFVAWDKAPILRDCGSLNGTQVLKPHKVLSPGVTHRLKDQQFILFADSLCQYHRLDIPLPVASRAPLVIEETPRVQGGTQSQGLLLAEDSEEELDTHSKSSLVKKSRTTSSPLATIVVPESDEEGASFAMNGPRAPFVFHLDSDTDEEEGQQLASGEASASRRDFSTEAEQPDADGIRTKLQLEKNWTSMKKGDSDTRVEKDRGKAVVPVKMMLERNYPADEDSDTDVDEDSRPPGKPPEGHLKRAQPSNFVDSDTDVEEVIPATPNVVLMNKKQIFPGIGMNSSGVPAMAQLQKSQRGGDAHKKPVEAQLAVHLERSQVSVVINSDTDDEEEVSAALTLAHLKESRAVTDHGDTGLEEAKAPTVVLLRESQTSAEKDSDTDVEEEKQTIIKGHTHKDRVLVRARCGKSQTLLRDSDEDVRRKKSSHEDHLERRQVTTTVDSSPEMEEEGPLERAVVHLEKYQTPVEGTHQTDVKTEDSPVKLPVVHLKEIWPPRTEGSETDNEEDMSFMASALADVRKSQLPAEGDAGTERAAAVLKRERVFETGSQGGSPIAKVEQDLLPLPKGSLTDMVVGTGTPGDLSQPHQKGAPTSIERRREPCAAPTSIERKREPCAARTRDSKSSRDAIQSMEDEPTQAFLCTLPQEEPGPSYCNVPTPGIPDEPWEVLATQPFCPRESETFETQHIDGHLEGHETCPSPPKATPQDHQSESPVHRELVGSQGRGIQTEEKDLGTQGETGSMMPEREPLKRETKEPPPGEKEVRRREDELTRGLQDREQKQVLAKDSQRQESDTKGEIAHAEKDVKSLQVEMEIAKEIKEKGVEMQTLAREMFEREAERPALERECELAGLEAEVPEETLEDPSPQKGDIEGGNQDQERLASLLTPKFGEGAGPLQGLASAPVASSSQSGRGKVDPMNPRRQRRGRLSRKMTPTEKAPKGDPESPDAFLLPPVPKATLQMALNSQSQGHPAPHHLLSPSLSLEVPIPRTRQRGSSKALEMPLPSELEPLQPKPKVRSRGSSRVTSSLVSSAALELCSPTPSDQPVTPMPASRTTPGRTYRSSVKTVEPIVPELQPFASKPTSRTTQGRTQRSSIKTPEPVESTVSEVQPSTSIRYPIIPEPISRTTRGRTHRSSVKTPEPIEPTASEVQPSTFADLYITAEHMSQTTQGRTRGSSAKTLESIELIVTDFQSSTFTDKPVTPKLTQGRTQRSSVKTPELVVTTPELVVTTPELVVETPELVVTTPELVVETPEVVVSIDPELQFMTPRPLPRATRRKTNRSSVKTSEPIKHTTYNPKTSTPRDQPITSDLTIWATQGRTRRSSISTSEPVKHIALESQPSTSANQPSTSQDQFAAPKPVSRTTRSRTHRSSAKTLEPLVPISPDLELLNSPDQNVTPEPILWTTQGRTRRSSVKIPEPVEPIVPDLKLPTFTDQHITPELLAQCGQSKTLQSSRVSAVAVPINPEPIPQASCNRTRRGTRKDEPLTVPIVHEPSSTLREPKSRSSRSQRQRAAESLRATDEPSCLQHLEASHHSPEIEDTKVEDRSEFTSERQLQLSPNDKRTEAIKDSPPPQKRPRRGQVAQKNKIIKKEKEDSAETPGEKEDVVIPVSDKRKRDQSEESTKTQRLSLRQRKSNQEATPPKVLFTGVVDVRGERAVLALGGSLASSVTEASHLVTDRICRTVKFLCALGRGIPILSQDWLYQSRKAGCFLPPDEYIVTDPEQEKNFGFNLREALSRAQKQRLLEGYEIHVTPAVQPPPPQMAEIISCCGGTVLPSMPRSYKPGRLVITCSQDFPRCSVPFRVGLPLLSSEFLLTGVLKQEANPEAFILSTREMPST